MTTTVQDIVRLIVRYYSPERIVLYGSQAKGLANERSDIDLAVILPSPLTANDGGNYIRNRLAGCSVAVDLHFYTSQEFLDGIERPFSLEETIHKTGRAVYER
jgi:predicted nucleotidyltransferase